jgi:3-mercaptopyruvate sulfurtransferase SseA
MRHGWRRSKDISILQASLEEWIEADGPVETHPVTVVKAQDLQPKQQLNVKRADITID